MRLTDEARFVLSLSCAFSAMVLAGVAEHVVDLPVLLVPLPGFCLNLVSVANWGLCVAVGLLTHHGAHRLM